MSCPPDKHHHNRHCPPQPRVQFKHRMDGNLQKLRCLFSHFFFHRIGAHDRNCAESLAPGAGSQLRAKFEGKPLERSVSLSRARSSCRSNVFAESCDQAEMATSSSSTASTDYNTRERRSDETYCSSVSAEGKDQELAMAMELHKLLDAAEEPFVLQDSIRDKIHPVRSKSSRGLMAMMAPAVLRDSRDQEDSLAEMIHKSTEPVEDRHHESAPCDASDLCTDQIYKVELTDSESNDGHNYGQLTQRKACDDGGEAMAVDAIDGAGVDESGDSSTLIHENAPFHDGDGRNHQGIDRGPLDLSAKLDQSSILQQFSPVSVLDRVSLEEDEDEDEDEDRSSSRYGMNPLPKDCCFLPADNHTSSISEAPKPIRSGSIVYDLELGCPYRPNNAAAPGHGGILHSMESFNDGSRNQALMASSIDLGNLGEGNSNSITSLDEPPDHDQIHLSRQTMWLHVPEEIVQELGRPAITSFVSVIDTMISPSLRGGSTRLQKHEAFGADDEYEAVREGLGLEVERSLFTVLLHDLLEELILQRQRQR